MKRKDYNILIGEELKKARLERGLTVEKAGRLIGVTHATISHYELGQRQIGLDVFFDYCDALGVDPYEVLDKVRHI